MKSLTCCFTGHRALEEDTKKIEKKLEQVIEGLIQEGVRYFTAGGAQGFDTLAALTVLRLRECWPDIELWLVLPCRDQAKAWARLDRERYEWIKEQADSVRYVAETYHRGCMHMRNRELVTMSARCVCYLTKPTGGTKYTVGYCRTKGVPVINIAENAYVF